MSGIRGAGAGRPSSIRPPRVSNLRQQYAPSSRSARAASPADSVASTATATAAGSKRKERDFDADPSNNGGSAAAVAAATATAATTATTAAAAAATAAATTATTATTATAGADETNINVVVRCRGRNEREIRENSPVVVMTDGVKGELMELSMGPNAISNKSYSFDRVFSPAADQSMLFDHVVKPIMEEMLAGFNCTIFAYGQTGTGKTYTMSGDMTETMGLLSDGAGVIPRVLHTLFNKMHLEDSENAVKCSFIELYNEELRDLISVEETAKLKIFDDTSRKGHMTTLVQGMEEKYIKSAADGIRILQEGSLKRKVAATKCNDLSSRSHTVFTITTSYVRRGPEGNNEDFVTTGKLNLVDLAGSENIQRSGAENKRAAEAGLINKSLLTLGRVINALVDRSPHIPYRESKLTRLLQDSLGGRTKTCIIATVSPAKVNLEETISTLDYAFRAKNIRNKPQVNLLMNKHILLQDFTNEIERLKSELISTRQRNGVYLSNEAYEEMSADRESRRIVMEEQSAKIETLESNLKNKLTELFELTLTFTRLKKDNDGTRLQLDQTKGVLDQTEIILAATRRSLAKEAHIRKAHQETEEKLTDIGGQLISKLKRTVHDVGGLHAKNKRKSDLHDLNRTVWGASRDQVAEVTTLVEQRVNEFHQDQRDNLDNMAQRMDKFVAEELGKLSVTRQFLDAQLDQFTESRRLLVEQQSRSKDEMDTVLEEIKDVRDAVKQRVGDSLQAIAVAAERIAGDVVAEMSAFHNQLHASYSSLGKDFKGVFEDLMRHVATQRAESESLRQQLEAATGGVVEQNTTLSHRIQQSIVEERMKATEERQKLMAHISELVNAHAEQQQARVAARAAEHKKNVLASSAMLEGAVGQFGTGMDAWNGKEDELLEDVRQGRDKLKSKLQDDWTTANTHSTNIQETTKSVHAETVRVVDEQVRDLDVQMEDLDDFVTRARSENAHHHDTHTEAIATISSTVTQSFDKISSHFTAQFDRVKGLGGDMSTAVAGLHETLTPLGDHVIASLSELRSEISSASMTEYEPTGHTPRKVEYTIPATLPRTQPHPHLVAELADPPASPLKAPSLSSSTCTSGSTSTLGSASASTAVFSDLPSPDRRMSSVSIATIATTAPGLREVNPNLSASTSALPTITHLGMSMGMGMTFDPSASTTSMPPPESSALLKRSKTATGAVVRTLGARKTVGGVENMPPPVAARFRAGESRRKSPRLN